MFYIGELHEKNTLMAITHAIRFKTDGAPDAYAEEVASKFLDKHGSVKTGDEYHFGDRVLRVGMVRKISAEQYQLMDSWQSITTV